MPWRQRGNGRRTEWQLQVWCVMEIIHTPDHTGMRCCSVIMSCPSCSFPHSPPHQLFQHIFIFFILFFYHFMSSLKWATPLTPSPLFHSASLWPFVQGFMVKLRCCSLISLERRSNGLINRPHTEKHTLNSNNKIIAAVQQWIGTEVLEKEEEGKKKKRR